MNAHPSARTQAGGRAKHDGGEMLETADVHFVLYPAVVYLRMVLASVFAARYRVVQGTADYGATLTGRPPQNPGKRGTMAIINPDGLFLGDRISQLSTKARLFWPYFFLLSNGHGRFEVNYAKIINRAFATFSEPPSKSEVNDLVAEYHKSYLLFLYRANGQVWGQWDTSERFLPRHKSATDEASPAPPSREYLSWKESYIQSKSSKSEAISSDCNVFENSAEDFQKVVRGKGEGRGWEGGGEGKRRPTVEDLPAKESGNTQPSERMEEFWRLWPNKINKVAMVQAWVSVVTVADEEPLFACLARWLASSEWARSFYREGADKWLYRLKKSGWDDWPDPVGEKKVKPPERVKKLM